VNLKCYNKFTNLFSKEIEKPPTTTPSQETRDATASIGGVSAVLQICKRHLRQQQEWLI